MIKLLLAVATGIGGFTALACVCACMLSSKISRAEERLEVNRDDDA